jgi:thymidine kinase
MVIPELNLIIGPMFAGKSTYLINKANELLSNGVNEKEILLINHSSDIRYDTNKICSHNGEKINSKSLNNLSDIVNSILDNNGIYNNIKYIFIDEGQFFNDLFVSIKSLLLHYSNMNINDSCNNIYNKLEIYISGLDGDYKQEPFKNSGILDLIPYSTHINKLNSKCTKCGNIAPFTKRIINSSETILIGGVADYQPVCISHLNN